MNKQIVNVPGVSEKLALAKIPLSMAVKAAGLVYVSGVPPMDPEKQALMSGDIATQTEACLNGLKLTLEAAGSCLEKVLKVHIYATNAGHYQTINEVYARYFPVDPPARTFVPVASFPMGFDIEIDCTALE